MVCLDSSHPDLIDFINLKSDLDAATKCNISVMVDDKFMESAMNNESYELSFYREETGLSYTKNVNARDVLKLIAKQNWNMGEPGLLFHSNINSNSIVSEYKDVDIRCPNPCFDGDMKLLVSENGEQVYRKFSEIEDAPQNVISIDGTVSKGDIFCSGEKETIKLNFLNKESIICTPEHRFMDIDGNEVMAKDLKGKKLMPFENYKRDLNQISDYIMFGFIQGDGCTNTIYDNNIKSVVVNIGEKDNDINYLFEKYKTSTWKDKRHINVLGIKEKLCELGFSSENITNRIFPSTYDEWDIESKRGFLIGCYSANGSIIKNKRVSYKTTCRDFADKLVETLLNDFGIRAYITTNKQKDVEFNNGTYLCKESYDINIANLYSIEKFAKELGFYQMYKKIQFNKLLLKLAPTVSSIEESGIRKVYDFQEPNNHWGCVNGVVVHNCGEIPMQPKEACLLGSFNLSEYVFYDEDYNVYEFDEFSFYDDVCTVVNEMNIVQEESIDKLPLDKQKAMAHNWKRIGIGIMGLADLFIKLGITYGSKESIELCDTIGEIMAISAIKQSMMLGEIYGSFPAFDRKAIKYSPFVIDHLGKNVEIEALRNSSLLSIAPTGTLSTLLGVSGGIEPIFANSYTRKTESLNGEDTYYKVYTPIVEKFMKENKLTEEEQLPEYFVTSSDIGWKERVNVQSAWQRHIDQAISSTVNLPESATVEDIYDIYVYAYKMGIKGITVFRDNCARTGILTTEKVEKKIEEVPDNVVGKKRKLITGCGSLHCLAYFSQSDGRLMECYLGKGSTGGCLNSMNGIARLISLSARSGSTTEEIVDQLNSTGVCPSYAVRTATKHDTSTGSCCPVAVGKALIEMHDEMLREINDGVYLVEKKEEKKIDTLKNNFVPEDMICPECGALMEQTGGCNSCPDCGFSRCG